MLASIVADRQSNLAQAAFDPLSDVVAWPNKADNLMCSSFHHVGMMCTTAFTTSVHTRILSTCHWYVT